MVPQCQETQLRSLDRSIRVLASHTQSHSRSGQLILASYLSLHATHARVFQMQRDATSLTRSVHTCAGLCLGSHAYTHTHTRTHTHTHAATCASMTRHTVVYEHCLGRCGKLTFSDSRASHTAHHNGRQRMVKLLCMVPPHTRGPSGPPSVTPHPRASTLAPLQW